MSKIAYKQVARVWSEHKKELSLLLHDAVSEARAHAGGEALCFEDLDNFAQNYLATATDVAILWVKCGDIRYYDFFVGWVKFCASERLDATRTIEFSRESVQKVFRGWVDLAHAGGAQFDAEELQKDLKRAEEAICNVPDKSIKILFIGDCLKDEIIASLYGPCAVEGISLRATTLSQRVPVALRRELKKMRDRQFDLIFFSPFSHAYSETFAAVINPRNAFRKKDFLDEMLSDAIDQSYSTLDLLGELFNSPISVHNAAAAPQHAAGLSGRLKLALTSRNRTYAVERIDNALSNYIDLRKRDGQSQYRLIDERKYLKEHSAYQLGRVLFDSGDLHPTLLGGSLAEKEYLPVTVARACLWSKKMVVCDLDNTLWKGVIGEGVVEHFHNRQKILKKLKSKGVLLSINSKNDKKNVHWTGGTLSEDDFVTGRINWASKVTNVKSIEKELNLKSRNFIFVDDRPDERELVKEGCAGITVLDACDDDNWDKLAIWAEMLPEQSDADRTQLYKERAARGLFISTKRDESEEDETEAYKDLGLVLTISDVSKNELKRVVELINRTNQFNMCGSRTTVAELTAGIKENQVVLQLEAADKFGSMGKVGAMVVSKSNDSLDIPIFVLSCRVFGFAMEQAMLIYLKKWVNKGTKVTGKYCETAHNKPCSDVYKKNGFAWDGKQWVWTIGEIGEYADWLEVHEKVNLDA